MTALRVRYETIEFGDNDIHLRTLRDTQEFLDEDDVAAKLGISPAMWPLFGIVWASGRALARLMVDFDIEGRRILEVGCGIGLASLVLNTRDADITATDRHPQAGPFLARNVLLNNGRAIPFVRSSWGDAEEDKLGTFDLIIGSDLLYERGHAEALSGFIERHARPTCEVVILDAKRGYGPRFRRQVESQGYDYTERGLTDSAPPEVPYRGKALGFTRGPTPDQSVVEQELNDADQPIQLGEAHQQ